MNLLWEHRKKFFACLGVLSTLALGLLSGQAQAATASTTFSVTATNLAFGSYTGALTNATSTISVTCTKSTTYNVGLDAGTSTGATVTTRKMTGPAGATLAYALYQDSAHTINWGNTVSTDTVSGTGNGSAQTLTVYGEVPAGQSVTPGAYTDTITATITY
jgi:spore coat protein U-like protein